VRPLLLETVVDRPCTGTCYRAANWILVQTQGRGRVDRTHQAQGSSKDILLYPPGAALAPALMSTPGASGFSCSYWKNCQNIVTLARFNDNRDAAGWAPAALRCKEWRSDTCRSPGGRGPSCFGSTARHDLEKIAIDTRKGRNAVCSSSGGTVRMQVIEILGSAATTSHLVRSA
jgi:hypothetical protein